MGIVWKVATVASRVNQNTADINHVGEKLRKLDLETDRKFDEITAKLSGIDVKLASIEKTLEFLCKEKNDENKAEKSGHADVGVRGGLCGAGVFAHRTGGAGHRDDRGVCGDAHQVYIGGAYLRDTERKGVVYAGKRYTKFYQDGRRRGLLRAYPLQGGGNRGHKAVLRTGRGTFD
jgi:hypothetical protein